MKTKAYRMSVKRHQVELGLPIGEREIWALCWPIDDARLISKEKVKKYNAKGLCLLHIPSRLALVTLGGVSAKKRDWENLLTDIHKVTGIFLWGEEDPILLMPTDTVLQCQRIICTWRYGTKSGGAL